MTEYRIRGGANTLTVETHVANADGVLELWGLHIFPSIAELTTWLAGRLADPSFTITHT